MRSFLLSIILFITANCFAQTDTTTLLRVGQQVPDFQFETAKGQSAKLSDYKGKVVIINFFATWCGPCRVELPELHEKIYKKHKDDPNFALFVFGREEDWNVVLPFKAENKFSFPMLPDVNRKIFSRFATQSIPRTLLIDKQGNIVHQSIGYNADDFAVLSKKVDQLLKN